MKLQADEISTLASGIRAYYADNVIERLQSADDRAVYSENYRDVRGGIPIPATLSIELGALFDNAHSDGASPTSFARTIHSPSGSLRRWMGFNARRFKPSGPIRTAKPTPSSWAMAWVAPPTAWHRNNSRFKHVVNDTQTPGSITDFSLFGCQPSPSRSCAPEQLVDIGNGGSSALMLFIYFPNGQITLGGNAEFEGVAWVNKLAANGNIRYTIPASGLADVLTMMGMGGANPTQRFPLVDYVTRATKSLRFF